MLRPTEGIFGPHFKHRSRRLTVIGMTLLMLIGISTASADDLNPAQIPADAQWLIHLDFEALSDSAMWRKIREEKPKMTQTARDWMKERYGINPPEDLKSLTLFSRDYREYTGTVIVQAQYEASEVESQLREATNHRKTQWQDYTLHTITLSKQKPSDKGPSGDQKMTVVMVDKNTVLLASSESKAQHMLKLLSGKADSLKGSDSPLLTDKKEAAWIYGAAINLGQLKDHPVAMPIIAQHKQINWSFGEKSDGMLYEQARLVAQSEQVAKDMETVLNGIVAWERLWGEGSKPMTELIQNVRVMRDGNTTGFEWQSPSDRAVAALDDLFARLETWQPVIMKHKQIRARLQQKSQKNGRN